MRCAFLKTSIKARRDTNLNLLRLGALRASWHSGHLSRPSFVRLYVLLLQHVVVLRHHFRTILIGRQTKLHGEGESRSLSRLAGR